MEFWGAEVKAGEAILVNENTHLLHISQASLGEAKMDKPNENAVLYLNINDKKLVLGTLFPNKLPQISFDLVFDRNFELSHTWKHGSVYFTGYKVPNDVDSAEDHSDSDSEDELVPATLNRGKQETENVQVKPGSSEGKKVRIVDPKKDEEDDDTSDESDDESSDDQKMTNGGQDDDDESDEDDEDSDDEDDESDEKGKKIAEKPDLKKKRVAESSIKTPVPDKKAKLVTPQKNEGKTSGGRVATPYPSKQASKAPASTSKNEQTAKPFTCKPCNRSFGSENALQSHNKAKHNS